MSVPALNTQIKEFMGTPLPNQPNQIQCRHCNISISCNKGRNLHFARHCRKEHPSEINNFMLFNARKAEDPEEKRERQQTMARAKAERRNKVRQLAYMLAHPPQRVMRTIAKSGNKSKVRLGPRRLKWWKVRNYFM
jgi:hypothetical protein